MMAKIALPLQPPIDIRVPKGCENFALIEEIFCDHGAAEGLSVELGKLDDGSFMGGRRLKL